MKPTPTTHNTDHAKPMQPEKARAIKRVAMLKKMNNIAYSIAGINFENDFSNLKNILK